MKIRTVLEGVGAALLFSSCHTILSPYNTSIYHHGLPVADVVVDLLLSMLGIAVLVTGALIAIERFPDSTQGVFSSLFAGLVLWRIVDLAIPILATQAPDVQRCVFFYRAHAREVSCIAVLLLSGILAYSFPRSVQSITRAVRLVVESLAFSALWIMPQLLYIATLHYPDGSLASVHLPASSLKDHHRRIIWILFDELSYDQTFQNPAPGVKLPNFDRLRTESVSFSNIAPAGFYTETIIPSLFLGRRLDKVRSTVHGDLWYKDESHPQWLPYDQKSTIFALAQQNGWSTGIDGFYNPYCHILNSVLNACYWEPDLSFQAENSNSKNHKSALANAATLMNAFFAKLTNRKTVSKDPHIEEYSNVMAHAHAFIQNDQVGFVFLHLPVPHPPGIYDRERHELRSGGNYLDNLALADDTLGVLLKEIDSTPSASETAVIVSSDHSWRIPIWRSGLGWTAEEERASRRRFDDRPTLLIHFAGQQSGNDVNALTPELFEHDIIAEMLRGHINNSKDLSTMSVRASAWSRSWQTAR